ncbi:exported protein [Staphylococcus aureus]|nr:exported protein [Staphylococcus aureus]
MRNIIFYLVLIIAAIGLVMNLDAFIFFNRQNVSQLCCNSWYYLSDLLFLHLN